MDNMTPKRKAEELWLKYHNRIGHTFSEEYPPLYIKSMYMECVLIAVDEIKEVVRELCNEETIGFHMIYWSKVKQEIENL